MEIREISFNSIQEFLEYISIQNDEKIRLFRGQMEDWPLDSKILRLVKNKKRIKDFFKIENLIFNQFKENYNHLYKKDLNNWEIISLGQHYGLPTRLIDWTKNPLIALWFAFEQEKNNENNRVVYGLVVENDSLVNFQKDKLFNSRFIKVFEPKPFDKRIINQESWFSIQPPQIFWGNGDGLPQLDDYNTLNENEDLNII